MTEEIKFERFEIEYKTPSAQETDWKFIESDWTLFMDGINKKAWEYNKKTKETRSIDWDKACEVLL